MNEKVNRIQEICVKTEQRQRAKQSSCPRAAHTSIDSSYRFFSLWESCFLAAKDVLRLAEHLRYPVAELEGPPAPCQM